MSMPTNRGTYSLNSRAMLFIFWQCYSLRQHFLSCGPSADEKEIKYRKGLWANI
ncbi:hypothetical protein Hanom_Chr01g00052081 [Helianthus anomalus]